MPRSSSSAGAVQDGNALEVDRVTVRFGKNTVLAGLSFEVKRGTALAIIGPNGCGKTVLFKALVGALPHEGQIRWAPGTRLGYVPQKLDIERDLPVTGDDLLRAKARVSGSADEEAALALAMVGLARELSGKSIGTLSGGQFQRLLVAVALVGRPDVLLLDEPTAGVDERGQETLNDLIDRLRKERGMTTLLISHDLSVVYRYASNVLCLSYGRACWGEPKTVLTPALLQEIYQAPVAFHVHDDGPRS
jgi:zinc transport system ATP-binding protein